MRRRKADNPDDYVMKVRHGRVCYVHKDIIRWRRKRKHAEAELAKAKVELEELTADKRELIHKRVNVFGGEDD